MNEPEHRVRDAEYYGKNRYRPQHKFDAPRRPGIDPRVLAHHEEEKQWRRGYSHVLDGAPDVDKEPGPARQFQTVPERPESRGKHDHRH